MSSNSVTIEEFRPEDPFWHLDDPHAIYQRLRRENPVHWYERHGFWFLTKYADVQAVSKDPRTFCSGKGFRQQDGLKDTPPIIEGIPPSLLEMDPPQHTRHRTLVTEFFTPRAVALLEPRMRELARESLDKISSSETLDFVDALSVPLPVFVIAEILGVPTSEQARFKAWSDDLVAVNEGNTDAIGGLLELLSYMIEQTLSRRASPRDDLLSVMAAAEPEGRLLEDGELGIFAVTLLGAGNETTRNLISGGAEALMAHPDQLQMLARDPSLIPAAVEEMLRWISPIRAFARTATRDTEIGGQRIAEDDFVVMSYSAANRDEETFGPSSESFDILRKDAPPHLGFGIGQHVCLGAHLARLEAQVLFEELLLRFPRFELAGEIERVHSTLINGIEKMPVTFYA